jgi:hypothetical protein
VTPGCEKGCAAACLRYIGGLPLIVTHTSLSDQLANVIFHEGSHMLEVCSGGMADHTHSSHWWAEVYDRIPVPPL